MSPLRILFVAPTSNLKTGDEILRSVQGQTITICDGNVDRDKAERFLREEQDYIHFASHGQSSILEWSDGAVTVDELLAMLAYQKNLKGVVITACNSARTGAEIHNHFHVPVAMCQAPIGDEAARRFSEVFYRALRSGASMGDAVASGRAVLQHISPTYADVVTLINGDDITRTQVDACLERVEDALITFGQKIDGIEKTVNATKHRQDEMEKMLTAIRDHQGKVLFVMLLLLLLSQLATPFLNGWVLGAH